MDNINEENKDHSKSIYNVDGEQINGNILTTRISRLENKENRTTEEDKTLERLKNKNKLAIEKIDRPKRSRMNSGAEGTKDGGNNFKNTWTVDDATSVPKPHNPDNRVVKGKRSKAVDLEFYESYEKEMENMKYLIEYMNNNKPKIT